MSISSHFRSHCRVPVHLLPNFSTLEKAPTVEDAYKELPKDSLSTDDRLKELEVENYRLRRLLNVVKPPKQNRDSERGPICQINFYHNDTSRSHKDRIIRLVSDYLAEVAREKLDVKIPQLPYQKSAIPVTAILAISLEQTRNYM